MTSSSRLAGAVALLAGLALAGCAGQGNTENQNAQTVALRFEGSIANNPTTACALLAPETIKAVEENGDACAKKLPQKADPARDRATSVQVYGKDAIVHVGTDTLFLARFADGWRVTAAGCTRQPDRPYDCKVRGN